MLKHGDIVLRAMEPQDATILYNWENDEELWYVSETLAPYSLHQLKLFIEQSLTQDIFSSKELRLMICNERDTIFGIVDLFKFDPLHQRIGIGIVVHKSYRNQGIASNTIGIIKDYVFRVLHVNQIWCNINVNNTESIKLFNKSGFEQAGILKQWNKNSEGNFEDVIFMQCIKKPQN
jgi:diamine N-acetyltransferase